MFLAIVLFIALFVFSLWFTSFIAKALGAERPGMLWVFLVFIAMVVVQLLLGLTPLAQQPIILLPLLILIATVIYAKILDMKLLGGFLTWLVSTVVMVIIALGIGIIAGVSLPAYQDYLQRAKLSEKYDFKDGVTLEQVALAAESVCQCETDKQCLGNTSREFGMIMGVFSANDSSTANKAKLQRYTERVLHCTLKPGPYDVAKAVIKQKPKYTARPVFEDEDSTTDEQPVPEVVDDSDSEITEVVSNENSNTQTPASIEITEADNEAASPPAYQAVMLADANKHIGRPARILRKSGEKMEGKITSIGAGKLMIEQRRYRGTFSFPLKFKEIERLEVYF